MRRFKVMVNGVAYNVEVSEEGSVVAAPATAAAPPVVVAPAPSPVPVAAPVSAVAPVAVAAGETPVTAPMPGKITRIIAKNGQQVQKGDVLLVLEAMKMQNEISAPVAGTVKSINVTAGHGVKVGEIMAIIAN